MGVVQLQRLTIQKKFCIWDADNDNYNNNNSNYTNQTNTNTIINTCIHTTNNDDYYY